MLPFDRVRGVPVGQELDHMLDRAASSGQQAEGGEEDEQGSGEAAEHGRLG